jgi:hypothetical protein
VSAIDNFDLLAELVAPQFDGDTFLYTELLDRSKRSGNNKGRRVHVFTHRTRQDLFDQRQQIVDLCQATKARAYLRVTPRSFEQVGRAYARLVLDQALTGNWTSKASVTRWRPFRDGTDMMNALCFSIASSSGRRPARRAPIAVPHALPPLVSVDVEEPAARRARELDGRGKAPDFSALGIELHRDNPTNLYIPADAA